MPTQLNQCKKHEYQKLVSKHKQQTQAANNELFLQAQKIVINFCEQWGTDFYTHQGDFFLDFGHPYHRAIKEKKFGEYHIYSLGDARYLLQFIAPDLLVL